MKTRRVHQRITVGLIQMSMVSSPEENVDHAVPKVREAARKGAQIVLLPELFRTRYFPQTRSNQHFELAEPVPGPTTDVFRSLARELKAVLIVPMFERYRSPLTLTLSPGGRGRKAPWGPRPFTGKGQGKDRYYNTAVVIDADGEIAGIYRKVHLPNDPCFYEKHYFTPGDIGPKSFETRWGRIGVLICWDQWFPEAARFAALSGAQILFYPSAIGSLSTQKRAERRREETAWTVIQRSHAIANGIYVAALNRVGREGRLQFWGRSFVAGPFGEVLASASGTREEVLVVRCDLDQIHQVREEWPFLQERRVEVYDGR